MRGVPGARPDRDAARPGPAACSAGCTGRSERSPRAGRRRSSASRSPSRRRPERPDDDVLVSVRGLKTYYSIRGSFLDRLVGARPARRCGRSTTSRSTCARARCSASWASRAAARRRSGGRSSASSAATEGTVEFEGQDITHAERARPARAAAADADRLPGPARVAQPGDDDRAGGRAIRSRSTGSRTDRERGSRPRGRRRSSGSGSRRRSSSWTSTRPISPAARSSGR